MGFLSFIKNGEIRPLLATKIIILEQHGGGGGQQVAEEDRAICSSLFKCIIL